MESVGRITDMAVITNTSIHNTHTHTHTHTYIHRARVRTVATVTTTTSSSNTTPTQQQGRQHQNNKTSTTMMIQQRRLVREQGKPYPLREPFMDEFKGSMAMLLLRLPAPCVRGAMIAVNEVSFSCVRANGVGQCVSFDTNLCVRANGVGQYVRANGVRGLTQPETCCHLGKGWNRVY